MSTSVEPGAPSGQRDDYARQRLGIAALAGDAAFYGSVRAVLKSLAFLLVPLYAHFLAPTEFGRLELVLATVALVDVIITAGMDGVFARFYFDRDDPDWRRRIITLYLLIETVYPALVVFPLVIFSASLSDRVFGVETYAAFFAIALVDIYLTNIVDLPMNLTRLRRKRRRFGFYCCARPHADPLHGPARRGLAPGREGDPHSPHWWLSASRLSSRCASTCST